MKPAKFRIALLLVVIYLAFIGLGLPDSLLGTAWPGMRSEFGAPVSYAGILSTLISGCTIVSSLLSGRRVLFERTGLSEKNQRIGRHGTAASGSG